MRLNKLQKLIFVYNAETGLRNQLLDGAHKILSPSTYECKLCAITFGAFTENLIWKNFRTASAIEMEFLHKDEYLKRYSLKVKNAHAFPIILSESDEILDVFISAVELNELADAQSLIDLLNERV